MNSAPPGSTAAIFVPYSPSRTSAVTSTTPSGLTAVIAYHPPGIDWSRTRRLILYRIELISSMFLMRCDRPVGRVTRFAPV